MDLYAVRRVCGHVLLGCMALGVAWTLPLANDNIRNGLVRPESHWPNATVHYKISSEFNESQVNQVLKAMQGIENASCIRFVPATEEMTAYVQIHSANPGCSSTIGYTGSKQTINLERSDIGNGCFGLGVIQHELLHTLGFFHQHTAPERDNFVLIYWNNIKGSREGNFIKVDATDVSNFGAEYDYGSVMHYHPFAFSENENITISNLRNTYGKKIGQRHRMSDADITRLNNMYKCKIRQQ